MYRNSKYLITTIVLLHVITSCTGVTSSISVNLEALPSSSEEQLITFRLTVSSTRTVPNELGASRTEIRIGLSSGLLLEDDEWTVDTSRQGYNFYTRPTTFQANQPQVIEFRIRSTELGTHEVTGGAVVYSDPDGQEGNTDTKLLDVTADGITIRDPPTTYPTTVPPCPQPADEGRDSDAPPCPDEVR